MTNEVGKDHIFFDTKLIHFVLDHTLHPSDALYSGVESPSVFTEAVLDNEFIQVIPSGQFEQVFTSSFSQGQVDFTCIE